jgi:hypothetical protein
MTTTAPQVHAISTDEARNVSVDMSSMLDAGETITGAPSIECSADLTITNQQYNSAAIDINGEEVAAGHAVQFTVESAVPGRYTVEILASTSEGQEIEGRIRLNVERSRY